MAAFKLEDLKDPSKTKECERFLEDYLEREGTFQTLFGYTDKEMYSFYQEAVSLIELGKYEKSQEILAFLTTLNPHNTLHWELLGTSQMKLYRFQAAIESYTMGVITDPTNPRPLFYMAACYLELEESEEALKALEQAIEIAKMDYAHREIEDEAIKLLKMMQKM